MIEVQVIGAQELIGCENIYIEIDGSEDFETIVELIEDHLDNEIDDDVASTLSLAPVDEVIYAYTSMSESLSDEDFMGMISVCVEYSFSDMEDFLTLCKDLGYFTIADIEDLYLGKFDSIEEFCRYFLEYELSQTDSLIEDNINWESLFDDLDGVYSIGKHYSAQH